MFKDAFSRFRTISFLEGLSYLLLVFIAMPVKYIGENPMLVKIMGPIHGVLFIIFCIFLFEAMKKCSWDLKLAIKYFIYSLIPFGFIVIEKDLKNKELA